MSKRKRSEQHGDYVPVEEAVNNDFSIEETVIEEPIFGHSHGFSYRIRISGNYVNIRRSPEFSDNVLYAAPKGQEYVIIDEQDNFVKTEDAEWICKDFIEVI